MLLYKRAFTKKNGLLLWLYGEGKPATNPLQKGEGAPQATQQLRWHPFREECLIYAAHWQGRMFLPPKDDSPLCLSQAGGFPTEIPFSDFEIAMFQNRFPSLHPDAPPPPELPVPITREQGFYAVVVYTRSIRGASPPYPKPNGNSSSRCGTDTYEELYSHNFIRYIMSFKNRGGG